MAFPVARIVSRVRDLVKSADDNYALEMINLAHRDLCIEFPIYAEDVTITLVADQTEYDFDESHVALRSGYYYVDASTKPRKMDAVDMDYVLRQDPGVVGRASGVPVQYYQQGAKVGFIPTPSQSTSSGYPKIILKCYGFTALTKTDDLPGVFRTSNAHVYGARRYILEDKGDMNGAQFWQAQFEAEIDKLERYMGTRLSQIDRTPEPGDEFSFLSPI